MKRRFRTLAILSLACLAVVLFVAESFSWYLKRTDEKLKKQLATLTVAVDPLSPVPPPKELFSALQTPNRFRIMHHVSDIPDSVKIAFAAATKESSDEDVFSMAEPGAWPWNDGDVIVEGLPRRRLRAVAVSESLCLVFYERGGFAKSDDIAAFRLSGNGARAIWHSRLALDVASPADLRSALRNQADGDQLY